MGGIRAGGTLLFGHLIYGVLLGWLAGGAIERTSVAEPQTKQAA